MDGAYLAAGLYNDSLKSVLRNLFGWANMECHGVQSE